MKRLFIIVLILLILYVLFTFFYPLQQQIQVITSRFAPSPTPVAGQGVDTTNAYTNFVLNKIKSLQKPTIKSAILRNTYQGTIIQVDRNNPQYPFILRLRSTDNSENSFILTNLDIILNVFMLKNGQRIPSSLDSIKSGDKVMIEEQIDLQQPWPDARASFTITVQ